MDFYGLHQSIWSLYTYVKHELNASDDIARLQSSLHLVSESIEQTKNAKPKLNVIDTSGALNGPSIIPDYGLERLCI